MIFQPHRFLELQAAGGRALAHANRLLHVAR